MLAPTHPASRWASLHGPPAQTGPLRPSSSSNPIGRSLGGHLDHGFRPDIEGLRAVAVVAVVLYHARLLGVRGGFVGVDVFFVVSGFLITRLILGELARNGRLALGAFWARRARRLLPAAALVVVATAFGTHLFLPPLTQRTVVPDVVAAGTFSSNLLFAHRLGSYFGAQLGQSTPSPLLHFWSLAVEEQFYLCWPPLLVLLCRRPQQYRRLVLTLIVSLGVAGFALAAWLTPRSPSWAFFLLPTRMGELLAGALLAVVGRQLTAIPARARAALAWTGLAIVVWTCFRFDETMAWPGIAVLVPVLATVAVIIGGTSMATAWSAGRILSVAVLQWIGRHSYALYLWHWPVLVFAESRAGALSWYEAVVAIVIATGLAALSVLIVEDPVRHARWLAAMPGRSLALGAVMVLVMLSAAWGLARSIPPLDGGVVAAAPQLAVAPSPAVADRPADTGAVPAPTQVAATVTASAPPSTVAGSAGPTPATAAPQETGPAVAPTSAPPATAAPLETTTAQLVVPDPPGPALAPLVASMQQVLTAASGSAPVPSNLRPRIADARDRALPYTQGCVNVGVNPRLQPCEFGVTGAATTILLYGDSHAVQWFEPLQQIALQRGYRLVVLAKGGCPVVDVVVRTPVLRKTCPAYRDRALEWITQNRPALVVVSNSYTQYPDDAASWAAGAEATMARLTSVAPHVVVIGDNPSSRVDPPACLSSHRDDVTACASARADAVRPDRIGGEVAAARAHGAAFVDVTDWFCTPTTCPAVIGDLLVLRDETHLTPPMAEFTTPLLDAALAPVLATLG